MGAYTPFMAMPFVTDHSDRFGVLALQLLAEARVLVLSHGPAVRLERGFLMKATTAAGSFYFKFVPDASSAELRSETVVLSALAARVSWVPRPYDFDGEPFFVATAWPRSGMAVVGTSCVAGVGAGRPAVPEGMCVRHPAFREGDCSPCRRVEMNRLNRGRSDLEPLDGMGLLARLQAARAAGGAQCDRDARTGRLPAPAGQ